MNRALGILIAVLVLFALAGTAATAGPPLHPGQARHDVLRMETRVTSGAPVTMVSRELLPATSIVTWLRVSFNGHRPQAAWPDSQRQMEYAWRGVILTLSVHKRRGPVVVRVASTRPRPVRVVVRLGWTS